jgi:hypothetical protein
VDQLDDTLPLAEQTGFAILLERTPETQPENQPTEPVQDSTDPTEGTVAPTEAATESTEATTESTVPVETVVNNAKLVFTSENYVILVYGDGKTAAAALEMLKLIQADAQALHNAAPEEITMTWVKGETTADLSAMAKQLGLSADWWRSIASVTMQEASDATDTEVSVEMDAVLVIVAQENVYCLYDCTEDPAMAQTIADSLAENSGVVVDGWVLAKVVPAQEEA